MKLILAGATGLVGSHVLKLALADGRIDHIVAPSRRALPVHPKLEAPLVDFDRLPADAPWWKADAVICALGTTMRTAGSRDAFRRVDHGYPMAIAELAAHQGTPTYVLNSALGADASSAVFYHRTKGELERDLERGFAGSGFGSLTFVRPGLIGGARQEFRFGERAAAHALTLLAPALPRRWRINPASRIAQAMIDAAIEARPGVHIVSSEALV